MQQKKNNSALIIFTRVPEIGKTKTRLESFLGKKNCVELHKNMLKDLKYNIKSSHYDTFIFYNGNIESDSFLNNLFNESEFFLQKGKDIWEKMYFSILEVFNMGYQKVILIGADIPLINSKHIDSSFNALNNNEIVITPTIDGGYCLIGMNRPFKHIFDDDLFIEGSSTVYEILSSKLKEDGISFYSNERMLDLDVKEDIENFLNLSESKSCIHTFKFLKSFCKKEVLWR